MNDSELDQRIRGCFLSQSLPSQSVESILAAGAKAREARKAESWWRPWLPVAAAAAIVMLVGFQIGKRYDVSEFTTKVAGEIAMRHNGTRPCDIQADSFDAVQNGLKDLAFSVSPQAKHGLLSAYEIVGARYCWLEGQQGVHLRVRNRATGGLASLYIVSLDGRLAELKSSEAEVRLEANDVRMWEDSNRLFALVE